MLSTLSLTSPHFLSHSNSSLSLQNPKPFLCSSNGASSFLQIRSLTTLSPTPHEPNNERESSRIKMPTPPWMKGPLFLPPEEVLHLSSPPSNANKKKNRTPSRDHDRFLTEKVPGRMGKKAANEIAESVERLQNGPISGEIGGGLFVEQLVGNSDLSLERTRRRLPWVSEEREVVFRRTKKEKVPTCAELSLDKDLLWRLRGEALKMRNWVKVNKIGVTESVVDEIHSLWANNELVMLRVGEPLCRNMDRAMEIVEFKTGGLVVWNKKDKLVVYRGCDYERRQKIRKNVSGKKSSNLVINHQELDSDEKIGGEKDCQRMEYGILMEEEAGQAPIDRSLYERESDRLLEGLGPRFVDWWYPKPLPVDADLLPEVVQGLKTPFRLAPSEVRLKLTDDELTYLRKFSLSLPTHFVLGRNSGLQGLAASILKLWERCIIAKIAIKWGVPNTNNELMASELKRLTGGVLLLRNKFFIILYRGKDFLPGDAASLVLERERELRKWQLFEEDTRQKANLALSSGEEASVSTSATGTLSEFHGIQETCGPSENEADVEFLAEKAGLEKILRTKELKLAILTRKIGRAGKELLKLDSSWEPSEEEADLELMTDEERECFKKIGLKMTHVLVLGRRGIFDGVIEGMHQHWKHREVVKVISKQKNYAEVILTATMLERESGGVLVSVDNQKEGHSIILYRGKNYRRPLKLGNNLLNKRKALKRSLEMQRLRSLNFIAYQRDKEISYLKLRLDDLERRRGQ